MSIANACINNKNRKRKSTNTINESYDGEMMASDPFVVHMFLSKLGGYAGNMVLNVLGSFLSSLQGVDSNLVTCFSKTITIYFHFVQKLYELSIEWENDKLMPRTERNRKRYEDIENVFRDLSSNIYDYIYTDTSPFIILSGTPKHMVTLLVIPTDRLILLTNTGDGLNKYHTKNEANGMYKSTKCYHYTDKRDFGDIVIELVKYSHLMVNKSVSLYMKNNDGTYSSVSRNITRLYSIITNLLGKYEVTLESTTRFKTFIQTEIESFTENDDFTNNRYFDTTNWEFMNGDIYSKPQIKSTCTFGSILWALFFMKSSPNDSIRLEHSLRISTISLVVINNNIRNAQINITSNRLLNDHRGCLRLLVAEYPVAIQMYRPDLINYLMNPFPIEHILKDSTPIRINQLSIIPILEMDHSNEYLLASDIYMQTITFLDTCEDEILTIPVIDVVYSYFKYVYLNISYIKDQSTMIGLYLLQDSVCRIMSRLGTWSIPDTPDGLLMVHVTRLLLYSVVLCKGTVNVHTNHRWTTEPFLSTDMNYILDTFTGIIFEMNNRLSLEESLPPLPVSKSSCVRYASDYISRSVSNETTRTYIQTYSDYIFSKDMESEYIWSSQIKNSNYKPNIFKISREESRRISPQFKTFRSFMKTNPVGSSIVVTLLLLGMKNADPLIDNTLQLPTMISSTGILRKRQLLYMSVKGSREWCIKVDDECLYSKNIYRFVNENGGNCVTDTTIAPIPSDDAEDMLQIFLQIRQGSSVENVIHTNAHLCKYITTAFCTNGIDWTPSEDDPLIMQAKHLSLDLRIKFGNPTWVHNYQSNQVKTWRDMCKILFKSKSILSELTTTTSQVVICFILLVLIDVEDGTKSREIEQALLGRSDKEPNLLVQAGLYIFGKNNQTRLDTINQMILYLQNSKTIHIHKGRVEESSILDTSIIYDHIVEYCTCRIIMLMVTIRNDLFSAVRQSLIRGYYSKHQFKESKTNYRLTLPFQCTIRANESQVIVSDKGDQYEYVHGRYMRRLSDNAFCIYKSTDTSRVNSLRNYLDSQGIVHVSWLRDTTVLVTFGEYAIHVPFDNIEPMTLHQKNVQKHKTININIPRIWRDWSMDLPTGVVSFALLDNDDEFFDLCIIIARNSRFVCLSSILERPRIFEHDSFSYTVKCDTTITISMHVNGLVPLFKTKKDMFILYMMYNAANKDICTGKIHWMVTQLLRDTTSTSTEQTLLFNILLHTFITPILIDYQKITIKSPSTIIDEVVNVSSTRPTRLNDSHPELCNTLQTLSTTQSFKDVWSRQKSLISMSICHYYDAFSDIYQIPLTSEHMYVAWLRRIYRAGNALHTNMSSDQIRKSVYRVHNAYVPTFQQQDDKYDDWLKLFQIASGRFVNHTQYDLIHKMITTYERSTDSHVFQALMGIGKSSIVVPAITFYIMYVLRTRIDIKRIIIVQPTHLVQTAWESLISIMGGLGRQMPVQIYRRLEEKPSYPSVFYIHVVSDVELKKYVINHINNNNNNTASLPIDGKTTSIIYDEIDDMINPLTSQMNIPYDMYPHHLSMDPDQLTTYYDTISMYSLMTVQQSQESSISLDSELIKKIKSDVQTCRRLTMNYDYGPHIDLATYPLAIPYTAVRTPSIGSSFSDPEIKAILTCFMKAYTGLQLSDLRLLRIFLTKHPLYKFPTIMDEYLRSISSSAFAGCTSRPIDILAHEPLTSIMKNESLTHDKNIIRFYMTYILLPKYLHVNKHQLNVSFMDMIHDDIANTKLAFSGTTNIRIPKLLFREGHTSRPFSKNIITSKLANQSIDVALRGLLYTNKFIHQFETSDEIITYASNHFTCLIDACAAMHGDETVMITANKILSANKTIGRVIVFSPDRHRPVEIIGNTEYDTTFFYFDQQHSRGTDYDMPVNTRALVIVDPRTTTNTVAAQATFRLRFIHHGQTADYAIYKPLHDDPIRTGDELVHMLNVNENRELSTSIALHTVQNWKTYIRLRTYHQKEYYQETVSYVLNVLSYNMVNDLKFPVDKQLAMDTCDAIKWLYTNRDNSSVWMIEQDQEQKRQQDYKQIQGSDQVCITGTIPDVFIRETHVTNQSFINSSRADIISKLKDIGVYFTPSVIILEPVGTYVLICDDRDKRIYISTITDMMSRQGTEYTTFTDNGTPLYKKGPPTTNGKVLFCCILAGGTIDLRQQMLALQYIQETGNELIHRDVLLCLCANGMFVPTMAIKDFIYTGNVDNTIQRLQELYKTKMYVPFLLGNNNMSHLITESSHQLLTRYFELITPFFSTIHTRVEDGHTFVHGTRLNRSV